MDFGALALRRPLCRRYSFAIPSEEAVRAIAALPGPIVELGAGTGYWASLIAGEGGDITAYDKYPPGRARNRYGFREAFFPVRRGTPDTLKQGKVKWGTLFLCWPCYNTDFALQALCAFEGSHVAYVGEGGGGCTGNDEFHMELSRWSERRAIPIPQWWGLNDTLTIYQRPA